MPNLLEVTECLICKSPLGQESRDMDYRLCHDHRRCIICGDTLKPREIAAAQRECEESYSDLANLPALLAHPRCQAPTRANANQDPDCIIKQSYLDYLNNIRLLWEADTDLSPETNEQAASLAAARLLVNQPLEKIYLHLARMQAAVAHISVALAKDRNKIKEVLDKREGKKFEKAKLEAATSARPVEKVSESEILLAEFMKINGIKERTVGKQLWAKRRTAIGHFVKLGFTEADAQAAVDKMMMENGSLKAPGEPNV